MHKNKKTQLNRTENQFKPKLAFKKEIWGILSTKLYKNGKIFFFHKLFLNLKFKLTDRKICAVLYTHTDSMMEIHGNRHIRMNAGFLI